MLKDFKAREVRKSVIEHLINIGYISELSVDELSDSPYLLAVSNELYDCNSVKEYRESLLMELNETNILKLQSSNETIKEDKVFEIGNKLIKFLNTKKISLTDNYEVIFGIQEPIFTSTINKWEIVPISPNACGSISRGKMKLIMEWLDENLPNHMNYSFSYTDYAGGKEKYGTSRPCISLR
jgi:hypothetical protein